LNRLNKWAILLAVVSMLLSGCDNAVRPNARTNYTISGDRQSMLYPLDVKTDGEDVRIQLKDKAPAPEIFSLDESGHAETFNFRSEGSTLIVPGKFDHLQLRHPGAQAVDLYRDKARD